MRTDVVQALGQSEREEIKDSLNKLQLQTSLAKQEDIEAALQDLSAEELWFLHSEDEEGNGETAELQNTSARNGSRTYAEAPVARPQFRKAPFRKPVGDALVRLLDAQLTAGRLHKFHSKWAFDCSGQVSSEISAYQMIALRTRVMETNNDRGLRLLLHEDIVRTVCKAVEAVRNTNSAQVLLMHGRAPLWPPACDCSYVYTVHALSSPFPAECLR